jgi:hypothetical protein
LKSNQFILTFKFLIQNIKFKTIETLPEFAAASRSTDVGGLGAKRWPTGAMRVGSGGLGAGSMVGQLSGFLYSGAVEASVGGGRSGMRPSSAAAAVSLEGGNSGSGAHRLRADNDDGGGAATTAPARGSGGWRPFGAVDGGSDRPATMTRGQWRKPSVSSEPRRI